MIDSKSDAPKPDANESDAFKPDAASSKRSRFAKQWNYRPPVPLSTSPLFKLPTSPSAIGQWFARRWLVLGENLLLTALAVVTWFYFQPPLEETKTLAFGWVASMYVRNIILMCIVAGGLHFLLYCRKTQGEALKFDSSELEKPGMNYTFNRQLFDNVFWTLVSGVFFWTAFEVLMFWGMANGYVPMLLWANNPILFMVLIVLTPMWISFHFYWIHRFLHWPPMYKLVHSLHHRNTNIGPWSGLSMHPIEHLLFFSSVLIHWLVTAHPIHILFHMQHQALTASTSHAGFENMMVKNKKRLALGNFHHQMHHLGIKCLAPFMMALMSRTMPF